ncbi:beta-propeller fold lactonase family protein [Streptomyces sp. NPDC054765]
MSEEESKTSGGISGKPYALTVDWGSDTLAVVDLSTPGQPGPVYRTGVGSNPRAVAVSADGTRAYVANYGDGTLSVVDLTSGEGAPEVLRSTLVGGRPCAVVAGLVHDQVCVADWAGNKVVVLDKEGQNPVEVEVGAGPCAVAAALSGQLVCVVNETDATVSLLELPQAGAPGVVEAGFGVPGATRAIAVAGEFLYVTSKGEEGTDGWVTVLRVRASGLTPVGEPVHVGSDPRAIAVSPGGDRMCAANYGSASVSIATLDKTSGIMDTPATVPVGPHPVAVAFAPDGSVLHVISETAGTHSAVDPDTFTRTDIAVAAVPSGLSFRPEGQYAYVTDQATGELITVRTVPQTRGTMEVGASSNPVNVAMSPDGRWAYTADSAATEVAVLDLTNSAMAGRVSLGEEHKPWDVAIAPNGEFACATSSDSAHLLVLTPAPGKSLGDTADIQVNAIALVPGAEPRGVAVTPDNRYALTTDSGTGTVCVVDLHGEYTIGSEVVTLHVSNAMRASGDGRTLYVVGRGENSQERIDTLHRTGPAMWARDEDSISASAGRLSGAQEMELSPDGQQLYVANTFNSTVSVLVRNQATLQWEFKYAIGENDMPKKIGAPHGLATSPDGMLLYISHYISASNYIDVFRMADGQAEPVASIRATSATHRGLRLALSPDGLFLYALAVDQNPGKVYGAPVTDGIPADPTTVVAGEEQGIGTAKGLCCRDNKALCVISHTSSPYQGMASIITLDGTRLRTEHHERIYQGELRLIAPTASLGGTLYISDSSRTILVHGHTVTPVPVAQDSTRQLWDVTTTTDGIYAYATDRTAGVVHRIRLADLEVTSIPVGNDPMGVASSPNGIHVYVANHQDNSISVLSSAPERAGTPLGIPGAKRRGIAAHPSKPYAYLVQDQSFAVLDLQAWSSGSNTTIGNALRGVATHPAGMYAYVADGGSTPAVRVVDVSAADRPTDTGISAVLRGEAQPTDIALHPRQQWGFVSGAQDTAGVLWLLDMTSADRPLANTAVKQPFPPIESLAIRVGTPDHLYVLTRADDHCRIRVLELTAPLMRPTYLSDRDVVLPADARSVAVHPQGGYAFVSDDKGIVHVLDLSDPPRPRLVGSTTGFGPCAGLIFRPDGQAALYATEYGVSQVVLSEHEVVDTWTNIEKPQSVAVSADGAWLFVTSENSGDLLMLDAWTGRRRFTTPAGTKLAGIAPHPTKPEVLIADEGGAAVSIVDSATQARTGSTTVGLDPRQVVTGPRTV